MYEVTATMHNDLIYFETKTQLEKLWKIATRYNESFTGGKFLKEELK